MLGRVSLGQEDYLAAGLDIGEANKGLVDLQQATLRLLLDVELQVELGLLVSVDLLLQLSVLGYTFVFFNTAISDMNKRRKWRILKSFKKMLLDELRVGLITVGSAQVNIGQRDHSGDLNLESALDQEECGDSLISRRLWHGLDVHVVEVWRYLLILIDQSQLEGGSSKFSYLKIDRPTHSA